MDERVAAIRSVALSHIIHDRGFPPETQKCMEPSRIPYSAQESASSDHETKGKTENVLIDNDSLAIQVVLDLDFNETMKHEKHVRANIQKDLAYAIGGDPRKVRVWNLHAGSVIAEVVLLPGCLADKRTVSDVLEDLQHQLKVPESRLMHGKITRHAIEVCHVTYNETIPIRGPHDLSVNSTVGADLTAWVPDETASSPYTAQSRLLATPAQDYTHTANGTQKHGGLSWFAGGRRVARNLFDKFPLSAVAAKQSDTLHGDSTFEVSMNNSISSIARDELFAHRDPREYIESARGDDRQNSTGVHMNDTQMPWRDEIGVAEATQRSPAPLVSTFSVSFECCPVLRAWLNVLFFVCSERKWLLLSLLLPSHVSIGRIQYRRTNGVGGWAVQAAVNLQEALLDFCAQLSERLPIYALNRNHRLLMDIRSSERFQPSKAGTHR